MPNPTRDVKEKVGGKDFQDILGPGPGPFFPWTLPTPLLS